MASMETSPTHIPFLSDHPLDRNPKAHNRLPFTQNAPPFLVVSKQMDVSYEKRPLGLFYLWKG